MESRNALDKSHGSPPSSGREALSLGHAEAFRYEKVPAELSVTKPNQPMFSFEGCPIKPHLIKRARSLHTILRGVVLGETQL